PGCRGQPGGQSGDVSGRAAGEGYRTPKVARLELRVPRAEVGAVADHARRDPGLLQPCHRVLGLLFSCPARDVRVEFRLITYPQVERPVPEVARPRRCAE